MVFFLKMFEIIEIICLLLYIFKYLGGLLAVKILKGRIKKTLLPEPGYFAIL